MARVCPAFRTGGGEGVAAAAATAAAAAAGFPRTLSGARLAAVLEGACAAAAENESAG